MLSTKNTIDFKSPRTRLAALIVFITILRETGLLNINFYTRQAYCQSTSSIRESSLSTAFNGARLERALHQHINKTPIVVLDGNDTLFYRAGYGPAAQLTVENLDTGPIWLPLYKPGYLNAHLRCHYDGGWSKKQGGHVAVIDMVLSGDIHVVGSITIIGPCSYRTSLNLMKQTVANEAVEKIQTRLQELEDLYESPSSPALAGTQTQF